VDLVGRALDEVETVAEKEWDPILRGKLSALRRSRLAMEVGTHSRWASQLLQQLGHEVLVANSRKLRAIYGNPRKGDRADTETMARLARLDPALLSPIRHRSPQAQQAGGPATELWSSSCPASPTVFSWATRHRLATGGSPAGRALALSQTCSRG